MKKHYRIICILVAFAMAFTIQGFASEAADGENLIEADWVVDYSNANKVVLTLELESFAGYVQTISAVMYDDGFDALSEDNVPSFADYYCMDEVVVKKGEVGRIQFEITNEGTPLEDGAYNILVQGSGAQAASCRLQIPVWVIRPAEIPTLISRFNDVGASSLMNSINQVKNPLQLVVGDTEKTKRLNGFISIRNKDYEGEFKTLNDVKKVWRLSEIIACLSDDEPDEDELRALFEANAELMEIDTENPDYIANADEIYSTVVYNNNISAASSIEELKGLYEEALAIEAINSASGTTISAKLDEYYENLGISESSYNRLKDCSDSQLKLKVQRLFVNKNFKTADKIKETFLDAVDKYLPESSSGGSAGGSGGSSGGGSGGGGGKNSGSAVMGMGGAVSAAVSQVASPQPAFGDCDSSHWAYSYIEELRKSNIVSGYADGNFYPDRPVKREEFVKMAVMLAGLYDKESSCSFSDVSENHWYYSYVASAFAKGVVNGVSSDVFGVGEIVTRQDVAVIIYRLLRLMGADTSSDGDALVFTDNPDIAGYALESVEALTKMSVISGYEDGTFRPDAGITRAEAAKIIGLSKGYLNK